jgi:hypothetical protein
VKIGIEVIFISCHQIATWQKSAEAALIGEGVAAVTGKMSNVRSKDARNARDRFGTG